MLNRTQLRQVAMDALRGLALIETDLNIREHCRMSADDLMYFIGLESEPTRAADTPNFLEIAA